MAGILRTFAIAAGAGVAFGHCTTARSSSRQEAGRDITDIEPLLERLETIERNLDAAGSAAADMERLRVLVDVRAEEIQQILDAEMEKRHRLALAEVLSAVDASVAERIGSIEQSLQEQAGSILTLRDRAHDTDANLKRLITAIERLCERTQPAVFAVPPTAAGPVAVPCESPAQEEASVPEFRSRIVLEEDAPKRPRFPLARLLGMIALVMLTQVLSN
jgi:hypothetical protein